MEWLTVDRVVLSVIALLVVVATVHESVRIFLDVPMKPRSDGMILRAVHCFSLLNNGRNLLSTKTSSLHLSCISGIRVVTTTWLILEHTYNRAYQYGPNLFLAEAVSWW